MNVQKTRHIKNCSKNVFYKIVRKKMLENLECAGRFGNYWNKIKHILLHFIWKPVLPFRRAFDQIDPVTEFRSELFTSVTRFPGARKQGFLGLRKPCSRCSTSLALGFLGKPCPNWSCNRIPKRVIHFCNEVSWG